MLGRRNIRDSIGYVTLGLFTHALLDELLEVKKRPEAPPVRHKMITIATQSLKAIRAPAEVDPSHWRDLVFQNYQEDRTLQGAFAANIGIENPEQLEKILDDITQTDTNKSKRLSNIEKATKFFETLAQMAIINAECPEEQIPPGARQLVS